MNIATRSRKPVLRKLCWSIVVAILSSCPIAAVMAQDTGVASVVEYDVDFNRDIRPILSENCFYCHGTDPEQRQADLRLDTFDEATEDLGGYRAIDPGDAEASEILVRMLSDDSDTQMPPPDSNRSVTPAEIELIRRWIDRGAKYKQHWAFVPPTKSANLPGVAEADWPLTDVDFFVLNQLERQTLKPSKPTSDANWLRRITLDMNGLPPTAEQQSVFAEACKRNPQKARKAAVDRVLASPHYGERLATDWLDVARYADTHGFNNDTAREMWRWRDWVIESFNNNKPYDEFITEQLAGDLLPNPTLDQRIATGFGRNHVINSEGGIIDEEYRVEYVADRVRTLGMAWLGLTLECARCHDHKYDPITQKDYYRFFAFFDNIDEYGETGRAGNAAPLISAPTKTQQAKDHELATTISRLQEQLGKELVALEIGSLEAPAMIAIPELETKEEGAAAAKGHLYYPHPGAAQPAGVFAHEPEPVANGALGQGLACSSELEPARISSQDQLPIGGGRSMTYSMWIHPDEKNPNDVPLIGNANYDTEDEATNHGKGLDIRLIDGDIEFRLSVLFPGYGMAVRSSGAKINPSRWHHVCVVYDASGLPKVDRRAFAAWVRIFIDGIEQPVTVRHDGLHEFKDKGLKSSDWLIGRDHHKQPISFVGLFDELLITSQAMGHEQVFQEFARVALPMAQKDASSVPAAWLDALRARLGTEANQKLAQRFDTTRADRILRQRDFPITMVMSERTERRKTHVRIRGTYSALGEEVTPGVPESVLASWPKGEPKNRLGLARWITQKQNPLTARVVVNRVWQHLFGIGLVKTSEDFGYQAEFPSHPELLDYLARDFVDSGWDLKALYRQILLSATYRQSSNAGAQRYAADPMNRLLARGPRVRLPAETIRDQALAVSGLLAEKTGGPSVRPYQPKDLYKGVVVGADYTSTVWHQSKGDDLYRRSLYTFWKRTVPHPGMLTFDAPDREFCTVRRAATNTPLQALNLMNAPVYVEASNQFARQLLSDKNLMDDRARLQIAFKRVVGRDAKDHEIAVLLESLKQLRTDFSDDEADPKSFVKIGESNLANVPDSAVQHAAMASIVSMLLNLDETITKH